MSQLTQAGIVFGNGQVLTKDPVRLMTEILGLSNKSLENTSAYASFFYYGANSGRGTYYNTRYSDDGYGNLTYIGQNKLTVTNYSDTTMRVNVTGGIFDYTDDTWRYYVMRDGSAISSSQHSGGTMIIDSGNQAPGGVGPYTTLVYQDIAANSSTTFWLYNSILAGSNYDKLSPYLTVSFNSWV